MPCQDRDMQAKTSRLKSAALLVTLFGCQLLAAQDPDSTVALPTMPAFDLEALDRSADPCVDFYQYSCGGWHEKHPMPPEESFWSRPFSQFAQAVDAYTRRGIVEASAKVHPTHDEQLLGAYYSACTDTAAIDQRGIAPLQRESAVIDNLSDKSEIASTLGALHRNLTWFPARGEALFWISVIRDQPGATAMRIGPAGLGLFSPDYYLDTSIDGRELLSRYRNHVARVFELAGIDAEDARRDAAAVVAMETELARSYLPRAEVRNDPSLTHNLMSLEELQATTPSFRWLDYLRAHGLPQRGRFNVRERPLLAAIERLIQDQPMVAWRAYLRWHLIAERTPFLPQAFRTERFGFFGRLLNGQSEAPPRTQTCFESIERNLRSSIGRMFVDRAFRPEMRSGGERMFEEVRDILAGRISRAEWLDVKTRREAMAKLDAMRLKIGHPDRWPDDPLVVVRSDDAYGNFLRAGSAQRRLNLDRVGRPPVLDWWEEPVTWVGGYYNGPQNAIIITAAMMLLYDGQLDDPAVVYGGLGTLLAHELIHGFDPNGSRYDASGAVRSWWTEKDRAAFSERTNCVAEQFSDLEYAPGIPIDGAFVVSEQFTEISAVRVGLEALLKAAPEAAELERAGLTSRQRYLITVAQSWCADATEQRWRTMAAGSSSKAWGRPMVHGTILNIPEFADTFGCSEEAPLVKRPEEICPGW